MYDLCFYKAIQHIYWVLRKGVYLFSKTNVIKFQKLSGLKKKVIVPETLKITVSGFFFDLKLRKWNINTWKSLWIVVLWSPLILKNQVVEDYFESSLNEWQRSSGSAVFSIRSTCIKFHQEERAYYESKKHFSVKSHLPLCSLLIFHVYMSDKSGNDKITYIAPFSWKHFM